MKVSGSRRRRKRKGSTVPPPAVSLPADEPRIVDTVGEDEGRISDLDLVDDLRRGSKPSSNRPRNEIGPLGIEDIRAEPPANSVGSDRPRTLNVVEINASEAPRPDPFGDEITTQAPVSRLFDDEEEDLVPEEDRKLAREYELDAFAPDESDVRPSMRPLRDSLVRREDYDAPDAALMSSVLGARPSLRPSPRPEKPRDSASVLWWLVVAALVGIIAAAGAIAAREQFAEPEAPAPEPAAPVETASAPAAVEEPKPPPVSFGTPQTVEPAELAKPEPQAVKDVGLRAPANPTPPSAVPAAQSAAARAGAANTAAATGAAAADKAAPLGPAASAVKPTERKARPAKPVENAEPARANYAPGYGKAIEGSTYAPGYNAPVEERPVQRPAEAAPAPRQDDLPGVPINPYE